MIKNKIRIETLSLAILLALVPAVNAQQTENFSEYEYYFPDYGPIIFAELEDNSDVIEIRGVMPKITDDKKQMEWMSTLETCLRSSKDKFEPYMKECGGPLVGFGIDYDGYLFVEFDKSVGDAINQSTIDGLYNIIEEDAKKMELSDIPVAFTKGTIPISTSRTTRWSPLIGGVKIVRSTGAGSTSSFAAEDSSGTKGIVISGHVADDAGGVGASIYHPTTSYLIGDVDYYNGVFADAAWVETSNVVNEIYYSNTDNTKGVVDSGDANNGSKVYMSGVASGTTSGYIDRKYIEVGHENFGTLYDQYRANYTATYGDSGAPVFQNSGSYVKLVGVHWGVNFDTGKSYFSPISGVELDLGVTPLIT